MCVYACNTCIQRVNPLQTIRIMWPLKNRWFVCESWWWCISSKSELNTDFASPCEHATWNHMRSPVDSCPVWRGHNIQYFLLSDLFIITFILCFYCIHYFIVKLLIHVLHFLCVCVNAGITTLCIYASIQSQFTVCSIFSKEKKNWGGGDYATESYLT